MADSEAAVTGRQRVAAAYKGGYADRVPAYPIAGSFAGCLDGLSIQEYCTTPTKATPGIIDGVRGTSPGRFRAGAGGLGGPFRGPPKVKRANEERPGFPGSLPSRPWGARGALSGPPLQSTRPCTPRDVPRGS